VTAPLGREYDDDAVGQNDGNNEANDMPESEDPELLLTEVLSAIEKVCFQMSSKSHPSHSPFILVAPKNHPSCTIKSTASPGMADRSHNLTSPSRECLERDSPYADSRCQNTVGINTSNAS
jgi:hypothetical protein